MPTTRTSQRAAARRTDAATSATTVASTFVDTPPDAAVFVYVRDRRGRLRRTLAAGALSSAAIYAFVAQIAAGPSSTYCQRVGQGLVVLSVESVIVDIPAMTIRPVSWPVSQDRRTRRGYLLLADISGYTAFLVGTELEHANAIVHELTTLIRYRLSPPMRFVKLEGDAVFCYADGTSFEDGERLVELIESCYFDFSNRLLDMQRGTTCRCTACASIGSLDLKFVGHYGTYVLSFEGEREDLAGPDVILVHRLLKNTVGDGGGPQAYALLTDPCLQRMPSTFDLPRHSESYESFGETTGGVHDLEPVIARMREARRVYVGSADADVEISFGEHPYPPAVVWQYFVDPEKRLRWQPLQTAVKNQPNQHGRLGPGASSHCAHGIHGDALREFLDWRPYSYFTNRFTPLGRGPLFFRCVETTEFTPTDAGTMVHHRFRLENCGPLTRLRFLIMRPGGRRMLIRSGRRLRRVLDGDAATERQHGPDDRMLNS